jgi:hypothetical protein
MNNIGHRMFGPRKEDGAAEDKCPACKKPFKTGDYTTLVVIGPGDSPEEQESCRNGRPYNVVAIEAHYSCVTGR